MAIQLCTLCCAFLRCCVAHTDAARRPKEHTWPTGRAGDAWLHFSGGAVSGGNQLVVIDSWELLGDVARGANRRDESVWRVLVADQCGCPILDRFGQGKYISGAMRGDRRSKGWRKCEKAA